MSLRAFGENDRHFNDFESLPPKFVGQLDLKAIAVGADFIQVEGLERAAAKTFVAAGRVAEWHAGDERHIFAGEPAQHQPAERPVDDADRSEEHTSELQSPCNLVC